MSRRLLFVAGLLLLVGIATGVYGLMSTPSTEIQDVVRPKTLVDKVSTVDEFDQLAQTDPVQLLNNCLVRYEREVQGGFHCMLDKQERIKGVLNPREEIDLYVRGDVPVANTNKTQTQVLMKWLKGARKAGKLGFNYEVKGVLYDEAIDPSSMLTWRPTASLLKEFKASVTGSDAVEASRYCIRDAGLYHVMLRTYNVWKQRKEEGAPQPHYLGRKPVEQVGGLDCYIFKRICPALELDPFELGGKPVTQPDKLAQEGFSEITIMIDAKNWLQVGTELRRPDGELVGAYYYKQIELNPIFTKESFEKDGLLKN